MTYEDAKNIHEIIMEEYLSIGKFPEKENFTCAKCNYTKECNYAWDLYNTDGDCLETK